MTKNKQSIDVKLCLFSFMFFCFLFFFCFMFFVCVFFAKCQNTEVWKNGPHTHRQAARFHSMRWEKGSLSCRCNKGIGGGKIEVKWPKAVFVGIPERVGIALFRVFKCIRKKDIMSSATRLMFSYFTFESFLRFSNVNKRKRNSQDHFTALICFGTTKVWGVYHPCSTWNEI